MNCIAREFGISNLFYWLNTFLRKIVEFVNQPLRFWGAQGVKCEIGRSLKVMEGLTYF